MVYDLTRLPVEGRGQIGGRVPLTRDNNPQWRFQPRRMSCQSIKMEVSAESRTAEFDGLRLGYVPISKKAKYLL